MTERAGRHSLTGWSVAAVPATVTMAILVFTLIGLAILASCGGGANPASSGNAAEKNLVLLVHGFQGAPENLRFYRDRLRAALSSNEWRVEEVTGLDPSYNAYSLAGPDSNTHVIERFIEGMTGKPITETGSKRVFFIGHSMGGLTARQFSVWHRDKTAKIFMLGTPNGGMNSLPATSWAGSQRMNQDDGEAEVSWIAWNRQTLAQAEVEHYLFIGVCTNPAVSLIEGTPNDGLVGAWSVVKLDEFTQAGTVIRKRELADGHGVIATPLCSTTLVADEAIATAMINNLKQGTW
jgi:hypothetical protein